MLAEQFIHQRRVTILRNATFTQKLSPTALPICIHDPSLSFLFNFLKSILQVLTMPTLEEVVYAITDHSITMQLVTRICSIGLFAFISQ